MKMFKMMIDSPESDPVIVEQERKQSESLFLPTQPTSSSGHAWCQHEDHRN